MISFKRTDSTDADFKFLVALLDEELKLRDGSDNSFYAQFNKIDMINNAVVLYVNDTAVACGAFKPFEADAVEIKRMYVLPDHRGKGIAVRVLKELETWAAELNFSVCVLETGKRQPEAIRLYEKSGYNFIPNYGQYANVENSVCMSKKIRY
jgi:GNAT superfamily N-acetyltransferase